MNEVDADRYDLIFMDIQMPKMDGIYDNQRNSYSKEQQEGQYSNRCHDCKCVEELNNLHKEEHFLFLSIRNNVIMCLENKKIKWKEANYEH